MKELILITRLDFTSHPQVLAQKESNIGFALEPTWLNRQAAIGFIDTLSDLNEPANLISRLNGTLSVCRAFIVGAPNGSGDVLRRFLFLTQRCYLVRASQVPQIIILSLIHKCDDDELSSRPCLSVRYVSCPPWMPLGHRHWMYHMEQFTSVGQALGTNSTLC